eukprot:TRINITY_DN167_c0_g2_i1.p1 TRINITY_DN167_c0_g2~~TRINITY_DN167_c0_g2_i1.p1  ORF type:complete len:274 (+),score=3.98 TRINITY_DN167_c0_g2_i1:168-989(+)
MQRIRGFRSQLYLICSIALLAQYLLAYPASLTTCPKEFIHENCAFIVSLGRSGSTALTHAVNKAEGVFIHGENKALFHRFETAYNHLRTLSAQAEIPNYDEKTAYFEAMKRPTRRAWFNSFPEYVPDCMLKSVFKVIFGHEPYTDYVVGFKEIRYTWRTDIKVYDNQDHNDTHGKVPVPGFGRPVTITTYEGYASQMKFLKKLCANPRIILSMRRNVTAQATSGMYKKANNTKRMVERLDMKNEWMWRYNKEDRKSTRLNSSHQCASRMPSSA